MKRLILALVAGVFLAGSLGGCIVVPGPGYYGGGGYHHDHDHDGDYHR